MCSIGKDKDNFESTDEEEEDQDGEEEEGDVSDEEEDVSNEDRVVVGDDDGSESDDDTAVYDDDNDNDNDDDSNDDESKTDIKLAPGGKKNSRNSKKERVKEVLKGRKRKLEDEEEVDADEAEDFVEEDDEVTGSSDPFSRHFERDLSEEEAGKCSEGSWVKSQIEIPHFGKAFLHSKNMDLVSKHEEIQTLQKAMVKQSLCSQVAETNRALGNVENLKGSDCLSPMQQALFSHLNAYQDVYYAERTHRNGEELRLVYCLHALNHVLKTRTKVISHNTKIKSRQEKADAEYRDQGLTRPKVLMMLPFRESATKVINMMSSLLGPAEQVMVSSKKRFKSEFGAEDDQNYRRGLKPEDFEVTFSGNNDDHFRLGIAVSRKSLKLYVPFYQADIILVSPLGLRTIIGAEGEKDRDFDFLSSIELLILDQTDIFLMQNWDHVLHMFKHLHLQPKESHGCDFSRVRMWTLNGWSHLYRQTLMLSAVAVPEINAIFNKHCHNYAGKVQFVRNPGDGVICQIITQTPQTFQRLACTSFTQLADIRFQFFIKKLLPHHKDPVMRQTLVYIPSYFDFVRIRNYFKKEDIDFVHMSEYASDKGISRVRCDFFHGKAQFLLYTERLHFFRRFRIRGIKHIIFYELPTYPHFYSEMCNMIKDPKRQVESASSTCTVMYSKYEAQKLAEVVGTKRTSVMLNAEKSVHMFVTGQDS